MIEIQYSGTALLLLVNPRIRTTLKSGVPVTCINYHLKRRRFVASYLCSTHYTGVQINNCLKLTSAIKVAPLKIIQLISVTNGSHQCLPQNRHFSQWGKVNGTQRRVLVSPWRMHCMYSYSIIMATGTSQAEAKLNSKTIKPVTLAMHYQIMWVWRHQSVRQLVDNSINNFVAAFWKHFSSIWRLIYLVNTATLSSRKILGKFTSWFALITFFVPSMNHYCGSWYWNSKIYLKSVLPLTCGIYYAVCYTTSGICSLH